MHSAADLKFLQRMQRVRNWNFKPGTGAGTVVF